MGYDEHGAKDISTIRIMDRNAYRINGSALCYIAGSDDDPMVVALSYLNSHLLDTHGPPSVKVDKLNNPASNWSSA